MYWTSAPDHRDRRSEDWITDAAEEAIGLADRLNGDPLIQAVMTPAAVEFADGSWTTPISMLLTDRLVLIGHKAGRFSREAEVRSFPKHKFDAWTGESYIALGRYVFEANGMRILFASASPATRLAEYSSSY